MALNLSNRVTVRVVDGDETIIDEELIVKTLTKKDLKKVQKLVFSALDKKDEASEEAMDEIEEAAKIRFNMMVSGKGKPNVVKFAEEYGYTLILTEIDEMVKDAKGKHS